MDLILSQNIISNIKTKLTLLWDWRRVSRCWCKSWRIETPSSSVSSMVLLLSVILSPDWFILSMDIVILSLWSAEACKNVSKYNNNFKLNLWKTNILYFKWWIIETKTISIYTRYAIDTWWKFTWCYIIETHPETDTNSWNRFRLNYWDLTQPLREEKISTVYQQSLETIITSIKRVVEEK